MTRATGAGFYERLGVRRVINGESWVTRLGGSIMPEPVVMAMEEASRSFVDMHELNRKAGDVIARLTGAEAGLVTAGSAAGMLLEAAACMTGTDPAKVHRLPDTTGMKNEIVIHRVHRVGYDQAFRVAGARLVEIGTPGATHEWEFESALNENTAAVAYIIANKPSGAIPLRRAVEIAHAHGVPVVVDAAAMLPPPENLTRYVSMGADMVSFSGGKGVLGPQSTGILCGRADLIAAASLNGAPNAGVGRPAKVCKEEIAGLITALELFVDTDHQAVAAGWRAKSQHIVNALQGIPGVRAVLLEVTPGTDHWESTTDRAFFTFDESWRGPREEEVIRLLAEGDPAVRLRSAGPDGGIAVHPCNLRDGEEEIIARRLREVLKPARRR